ncbi:Riboflavin transporter FmnP [Lachnospiraceae bacterium YSD2013]|nr:ECF transporter S component [Lachnospiraceae bacterium]SCX19391.1 Riboflavin transporter FmnP [Lachnospiraceae bacterium YSD2013]MBO4825151.1 ECF transporter S component [Lachnospiraceae bacterium]MBR5761102.1 ECF transporter S component [Lachnospiraceae bacterium]MBR5896843.1 ECF transporter S component [Lachnospiraceae bacterium]
MSNASTSNVKRGYVTRVIVGSGMLAALAVVLQTFLEFPVPALIPGFIKFDFSDLPALVGSFAYGPIAGVAIELVKNLIHCLQTKSATVGELSNFLLGAVFVATAGLIYMKNKTKKTALIGGIVGAVVMGIFSVPSNYFVVYPFYYNFMPKEAVLGAYQAIMPSAKSIMQCLLVFNLPFTIIKGLACVIITMLIYKPLSRFLKGNM